MRVRAITNEEWAAMAVRAENTLSKGERDALDAAESKYHRQENEEREDEAKVSSFADMLQMWGTKVWPSHGGGGGRRHNAAGVDECNTILLVDGERGTNV